MIIRRLRRLNVSLRAVPVVHYLPLSYALHSHVNHYFKCLPTCRSDKTRKYTTSRKWIMRVRHTTVARRMMLNPRVQLAIIDTRALPRLGRKI